MDNGRRMKRMVALLLATTMAWTGLVPDAGLFDVQAKEGEENGAKLIASFNFNDATEGSDIVVDGAKAVGSFSLIDGENSKFGKALSLNGNGQFLTLTDDEGGSLLTGMDAVSISANVQFNRNSADWLFYAAPNLDPPTFPNEHYLGILQQKGNVECEMYDNYGARNGSAVTAMGTGDWYHLDVVFSTDATDVYVNGVLATTFASGFSLQTILKDASIVQIGKANWGNGEYCNAYIDDLSIYEGVLTQEQVSEIYSAYTEKKKIEAVSTDLSINAGYVTDDIKLPAKDGEKDITWSSSDESAVTSAGVVTRGASNKEVTLTATVGEATKDFKVVVLAEGKDLVTYVSNSPAVGQSGGMKIAVESEGGYTTLHKGQPILYTSLGNRSYTSPVVLRAKEGNSFFVVAADGGSEGLITYKSDDLITFSDEKKIAVSGVKGITKIEAVYDMTEEQYEIYMQSGANTFRVTSADMVSFSDPVSVDYEFSNVENGPSDAIMSSKIGLTNAEYDAIISKFSNPYNTSVSATPTESIKVKTGTTEEELQNILDEYLKDKKISANYSNGESKNYSIRFTQDSVAKVDTKVAGTYKLTGVIGGSGNFTEAYDELIPERADPFVIFNEDDGYYYFTASYPMMVKGDAEGYDRIVLRRAKTIAGLKNAEEVIIWDENESKDLGRFIWAPEMHKIGDAWYLVATAGLNTGSGTTFDIRPFMIKFEGDATKDSLLDVSKWGDPELVKAAEGDNILNGMSLDMTYFKSGNTDYLIWADETINEQNPSGLSYLFIATIDPSNPTQLTSKAKLLTKPEFTWETVNYKVNEGPGVFHKDGKVYMTFSASGTGSEYCVGLMYANEGDDLTDASKWTKLPYPIMTSSDFDNEVSGPGHNSFTYDENGNLVIVYHARVTAAHGSHTGDSLFDPCRNAYVKTVLFDEDGLPIFNLSEKDFIKGGDEFTVDLVVEGESITISPVLEYNFNETLVDGTVKDSVGNNDAKVYGKPKYEKDDEYGQVLYLDGDTSYGGHNSYLEFPKGYFDGKDQMTISFDVKEVTRGGNYFTFALGKDTDKYLFYKAFPTSEKLAITKSGYKKEQTISASSKYPNTASEWINIKIVVDNGKLSLYRDGELIKTNKNTGIKISDLGSDLIGYIGKSFYEGDIYFRGYFDNIKVYDEALTTADVAAIYLAEQNAIKAASSDVQTVADSYVIPHMNEITGNINLPSEINGVKVTWKSSSESVISTKVTANENYDDTPAGVVTRQKNDTNVTLLATFEKDDKKVTKRYECTVKAKKNVNTNYAGYLFVHFNGTQETAECEQMYFSVSKDGLNWTDLNNNQPVMTSTIGESGLRDMYIARSADGDKFYMISTDLSIYHYDSWAEAGSNGSHSIVVWESEDLVTWSEPWLAEIAPENAGCTWAPEFIYDEKTGEYIVYWSATTLKVDAKKNVTQDYENHAIYYCKTRDFVHFTEPELYRDGGKDSSGKIIKVIDSTMIQGNDGNYYRYTKNESNGSITIDVSDSVLGQFTDIKSASLDGLKAKIGAVEGPIIFKLNEKNVNGQDQWCLLVDRFAKGEGYYPLITTDLASGEFTMLSNIGSFENMTYRHGYVMPITTEEYEALVNEDWVSFKDDKTEVKLSKSASGNPMLGFDENGDVLYGGDPSILVDGEKVYAYVGHDTSTNNSYNMPDWIAYSTTDMKEWTYEGKILSNKDITWAADSVSAWAGQVVKYGNKYYFYYCTEAKKSYGGGKCIGVAVSDSPTGGFVDIGKPLVKNIDTYNGVSTWEDIDPTFWIEKDEKGVEHRILGWGNVRFFNCELNEDMISIKDQDGDPNKLSVETAEDMVNADIKVGVIKEMPAGHQYTEAPYYYKHKLANGKTRYYMFFAYDWREQMAYAYADSLEDFLNNEWTFGGVVMEPSATANTNHMAVFDFKGQTYFVYHDGSLANGSGYRRVACVEPITINEDGSIDYIKKTAAGLTGTVSTIKDAKGNLVAAKEFENSLDDSFYPIMNRELYAAYYADEETSEWVIREGKASKKSAIVSIESNYKPGLYITAGELNADGTHSAVLSQNATNSAAEKNAMSFRTILGLTGKGVTFESVMYPGYYLANIDGKLVFMENPKAENATFFVEEEYVSALKEAGTANKLSAHKAEKSKRMYVVGETINVDDIRVRAKLESGKLVTVSDIKTDVTSIDMTKAGKKSLVVSYAYDGLTYEDTIEITVVDKSYRQTKVGE